MVGYGLTDLKFKGRPDYKLIDPRINQDSILFGYDDDKKWNRNAYVKWLKNQEASSADKYFLKQERHELQLYALNWTPKTSIIHQSEYGLGNVLLIHSPCHHETWWRYSDIIDHIEETKLYQTTGKCNRVEELAEGIHPYDHLWMDSRTGQWIDAEDFVYTLSIYRIAKGHKANTRKFRAKLTELAVQLGFANWREAVKYISPFVPLSVQYLCRFGKLFKDEAVIWQLRPLLYVYWG